MRFRLTYAGQLLGASRSNTRAAHKHQIRKHFHSQLKWFWENTRTLSDRKVSRSDEEKNWGLPSTLLSGSQTKPYLDHISENFMLGDFKFAPVVTEEMTLAVSLDILLLRANGPNALLKSGDIDNRLKTLFDALRRPTQIEEIKNAAPTDGEEPFFVLLEDDRLINRVAVETDALLEAVGEPRSDNDARIVIDVRIVPTRVGFWNLDMLGD